MLKNNDLERTLALAGLFQAARLVDDLAHHGSTEADSFEESINSIFALDPDSLTDVYNTGQANRLGLDIIESVFGDDHTRQNNAETIRYALAIIQLERMLSKRRRLLESIRQRLERSREQAKYFDSKVHHNVVGKLANIYIDTLGSLSFRIQVRGKVDYLTNPAYVDKVRASLLAGIRSAMLWRQLGGRRWHLIFIRKRLLSASRKLVMQNAANTQSG